MIYLRTGKPGASKSLNTIVELVRSHDFSRPYFYTNVTLFMLDYDVACSFSGWFYGWYFPRLKNRKLKNKLIKIMKRVHSDDEFVTEKDVPFLLSIYSEHDHFDTWLHWVRTCYSPKQREQFEELLDNCFGTDAYKFESFEHFNFHFTKFDDGKRWFELPKSSVIWIDECQQFFPPRGVGVKVPEYISQFETHRHKGYDIHLVTQDPKLMDVNIRRLTGRHIHFHNPFGGERVTRYQDSKAFDPDQYFDTKGCEKSLIKREKSIYGVYWSAEIHTHKFKLPKFVWILVFILIFMFASFYLAYKTLFSSDASVSSATVSPVPELSVDQTRLDSNVITNNQTNGQAAHSSLSDFLKDVYISGTVIQYVDDFRIHHYSFVRSDDVFYPDDIDARVIPVSRCRALIVVHELTTVITCNPFYKRSSPKKSESFHVDAEPDTFALN